MAQTTQLKAARRQLTGRKVKQLRRQGLLPANIYGREVKSMAVELNLKEFKDVFSRAGETNVIELVLDKEARPRPVLIQNIQQDPVRDTLLHADLLQVDLSKKVTVTIPVVTVGTAPGVTKGGVLVKIVNELEIEALPQDIPDKLEVDISGLEEIGQGITLKGIPVDQTKVKIMAENQDELIIKVEPPAKEEAAPPPAAAAPAAGQAQAAAEPPAEKKTEAEAKPQS